MGNDTSQPKRYYDLRYKENIIKPKTLSEKMELDGWCFLNIIPFVAWAQLLGPFLVNLTGVVWDLEDKKGNNYQNHGFLLLEHNGPWGVFKWYNMFNFEGWAAAFGQSVFMAFFFWVEPFIWIAMIVNGEITPD